MRKDDTQNHELLIQARSHAERVFSHLKEYAASSTGPKSASGAAPGADPAEAEALITAAAEAASRLLLDIQAAVDKVPSESIDPSLFPGGRAKHD